MSDIDKVTRLLEMATLHRLREELDLTTPGTSETSEPRDQSSPEDPEVVTEEKKAVRARG